MTLVETGDKCTDNLPLASSSISSLLRRRDDELNDLGNSTGAGGRTCRFVNWIRDIAVCNGIKLIGYKDKLWHRVLRPPRY